MELARHHDQSQPEHHAAQPRRADSAHPVLDLQRTAGNQAVARALMQRRGSVSGRSLARTIEIDEVDFDPTVSEFSPGRVNEANFYPRLSEAITNDERFKLVKGKVREVMAELRNENFNALDVPRLTPLIVDRIEALFIAKQMPAISGLKHHLPAHVTTALSLSITRGSHPMDRGEEEAFDRLKLAAGEANMSRSKGQPSVVQYNRLPGVLKSSVDERVAGITLENGKWTAAGLTTQFTIPLEFSAAVSARQRDANRYQGNHTNSSGWLPAGAMPVNRIQAIYTQIYPQARPELQKRMDHADPAGRLNITGQYAGLHNPHRTEYEQLSLAARGALTDQQLRRSVWAALAHGVSPYIEFSTKDEGISRLIYNCVTDEVYLTAHYKWREGYNPFFHVEGAPTPAF